MKNHVEKFLDHIHIALDIADKTDIKPASKEIQNVLILGMGGSGIGGSIAAQVLSDELKVPVLSSKDYNIPAFVSENTMVIASSYSGNTEETLMALAQTEKKTKSIFCICSGGKIQDIAIEKGYDFINIPGGIPPRAAFGYSFPQIFKLFRSNNLIDWSINERFSKAIKLLQLHANSIKSEAKSLAEKLRSKRIIIYSETEYEGVCIRFRQQINENSKKLCWHHVFPEMNHNELVGWREESDDLAVVLLRNEDDFSRNQTRMELCKGVFSTYSPNVHEIWSKGENRLERSLYLIHLCDWISVDIAEMNQTDPIEIEVINYLKTELGKV